MEDKMVEIAQFQLVEDAEVLVSLLQSEGIECYVRDGLSSSFMFGNIGGAKVELLQKDMLRATEIMKGHGYEVPEEPLEQLASGDSEPDHTALERSKTRLSKTMAIIVILIIVLSGLIIFLNQYFNG